MTDLEQYLRDRRLSAARCDDLVQAVALWGTGAAPYALGLLRAVWDDVQAGRPIPVEGWGELTDPHQYWAWLTARVPERDLRELLWPYLERWGVVERVGAR